MEILFVVLLVLICHAFLFYLKEKLIWNKGICRHTKKPWEYRHTDLNGVRLYTSEDWSATITYTSIDKRP